MLKLIFPYEIIWKRRISTAELRKKAMKISAASPGNYFIYSFYLLIVICDVTYIYQVLIGVLTEEIISFCHKLLDD